MKFGSVVYPLLFQAEAFTLYRPNTATKIIGKALDFQCFTGDTTKYLYEKYPQMEIYGVDSNPKMVAIAHQKYPFFHFATIPKDAIISNLFQTKFDVIQVSDYQNFMETFHNMYDLLKEKNGLLYFYYHEKDKHRIQHWLDGFHNEGGQLYFQPNIIHHDKVNNFFILRK